MMFRRTAVSNAAVKSKAAPSATNAPAERALRQKQMRTNDDHACPTLFRAYAAAIVLPAACDQSPCERTFARRVSRGRQKGGA